MVELFAKKPSDPSFQLPLHAIVIEFSPGKVGWLQLQSKKSKDVRSIWFNVEANAKKWLSLQKSIDPRCRVQTYHKVEDILVAGRSLKSVGCTEVALFYDKTGSHGVILIDDFIGHIEQLNKRIAEAGLDKRLDPAKVGKALQDAGLTWTSPEEERNAVLEKVGYKNLTMDHDSNLPIKVINLNCTKEGCTERYAELSIYHIKAIDLMLESVCARCGGASQLKYKTTTTIIGQIEPLKVANAPHDPEQTDIGCVKCEELLIRLRISPKASAVAGVVLTMTCAQCGAAGSYELGTKGPPGGAAKN